MNIGNMKTKTEQGQLEEIDQSKQEKQINEEGSSRKDLILYLLQNKEKLFKNVTETEIIRNGNKMHRKGFGVN